MPLLSRFGRYKDFGLLLMRVGIGVMMALHGYPKMIGGTARWKKLGGAMANLGIHDFPGFWGFMAASSETIGGVLIVLGLLFRPAALLLVITMTVAAVSHLAKGDGLMDASHAIELAFVYAGLLFVGPGRYSLDRS